MVIFLAGFVSIILLRMLKKDYARYDKEESSLGDLVIRMIRSTLHNNCLLII